MPLKRGPLGGGTNADGSRNTEYCSHCFREGSFTQPEITALVEGKLRSMPFPGFLARRFARTVPTLRRWQPQSSKIA
ncbi:MAG: hypothetical protein JWN86_1470 [Planctomycetota bacterium]|nr:hypothetical protein [Planctomycetota bacterium]